MKIARLILDGAIGFVIVFIVATLASYVYSLVAHRTGAFDWGTSVRLGVILAIVLPYLNLRQMKSSQE